MDEAHEAVLPGAFGGHGYHDHADGADPVGIVININPIGAGLDCCPPSLVSLVFAECGGRSRRRAGRARRLDEEGGACRAVAARVGARQTVNDAEDGDDRHDDAIAGVCLLLTFPPLESSWWSALSSVLHSVPSNRPGRILSYPVRP